MIFRRYILFLVVGALIALIVFENILVFGLGSCLAVEEVIRKHYNTIIHPSSPEEAAS